MPCVMDVQCLRLPLQCVRLRVLQLLRDLIFSCLLFSFVAFRLWPLRLDCSHKWTCKCDFFFLTSFPWFPSSFERKKKNRGKKSCLDCRSHTGVSRVLLPVSGVAWCSFLSDWNSAVTRKTNIKTKENSWGRVSELLEWRGFSMRFLSVLF